MFLIGIGNQTKSTAFTLLAHETIGYTLVPISGYSYYTSTTGSSGEALVMLGYYNTLVYTLDGGRNWIEAHPGITGGTPPLYANNIWVSSRNNDIYVSTDGINYKSKLTLPSYVQQVVKFNNKFYIYCANNIIYKTADGINIINSYQFNGTYGTMFVAENAFYVSSSGGEWLMMNNDGAWKQDTLRSLDSNLPTSGYNNVQLMNLVGNKLFMQYAGYGDYRVFVVDRDNWGAYYEDIYHEGIYEVVIPTGSQYIRFSYINNYYFGISSNGDFISSTDLVNWNQISLRSYAGNLVDIQAISAFNVNTSELNIFTKIIGKDNKIATIDNRGNVYTSPDNGVTWAIYVNNGEAYAGYWLGLVDFGPVYGTYFLWLDYANNLKYFADTSVLSSGDFHIPMNFIGGMQNFIRSGGGYYTSQTRAIVKGNKLILTNPDGGIAFTDWFTDGLNGFMLGNSGNRLNSFQYYSEPTLGNITTLKEVQIAIGGQGIDGTAETLVPVAVYTVTTGKTAKITEIKVNNLHASPITYDLGKLSKGQTLTQAHSIKWDTALAGNASDTITQVINMVAGDTITILPSSVNTVSVAIYGTESNA